VRFYTNGHECAVDIVGFAFKQKSRDTIKHNTNVISQSSLASYFRVRSGKNLLKESVPHHHALLQSSVWKLYSIFVVHETNLMMFANNNTIILFVLVQVNCLPLVQVASLHCLNHQIHVMLSI